MNKTLFFILLALSVTSIAGFLYNHWPVEVEPVEVEPVEVEPVEVEPVEVEPVEVFTPDLTIRVVNISLPELAVNEDTYFDVTIQKVYPDGIGFFHRDGVARIDYENLPPIEGITFDERNAEAFREIDVEKPTAQYAPPSNKKIEETEDRYFIKEKIMEYQERITYRKQLLDVELKTYGGYYDGTIPRVSSRAPREKQKEIDKIYKEIEVLESKLKEEEEKLEQY